MTIGESYLVFQDLVKDVDWKALRAEQGIRHDMNIEQYLLIRYLNRHGFKVKTICDFIEYDYKKRQVIYNVINSQFSAYKRIEKELALI